MKTLFIINDAPYGLEKPYNALRLAVQMQKDFPHNEVCVLLLGDAVGCALPQQETPNGYYNIERMLKVIIRGGGKVKLCGTCMDARGLKNTGQVEGAEKSSLAELASLSMEADKVITF